MLFVISMMIEDEDTGAMTLVQGIFPANSEDEALGQSLRKFKGYGSVHSYKISCVDDAGNAYEYNDIDPEVVKFLQNGQKILAIKRRREITREGLKEAKMYIDGICAKYPSLLQI